MRRRLPPPEKEAIRQRLVSVLSRQEAVVFAYLYGSFVLEGWFADVDVGVYVRPDCLQGHSALDVAFSLADTLEKEVGLPADVQILNTAPLALKWEILRGQPLVNRDPMLRADFIEQTTLAWWDTEILRRAMVG